MRKTLLCSSIIILAMFALTGCPWTSDATSSPHNAGNATGWYTGMLYTGTEPPFFGITIWHDGNTLRAQDDRGIIWHGQTGADIPTTLVQDGEEGVSTYGGFQGYLETTNQETTLTEWMRGDFYEATLIINGLPYTGVWFEGTYSRSDTHNSGTFLFYSTTSFRMPGTV